MTRPCFQSLPHAIALALAFGTATPLAAQNVNLGNLLTQGFRIDGSDAGDGAHRSVSGAGDVNGDGLADVIIGASTADPGGRSDAGVSFVVFGKSGNSAVDLDNLGDAGFRINGVETLDFAGCSVSGAGDVNGDGLADLIVGAYGADPGNRSRAGASYVVFGKADNAAVDLATLGTGGFRIDGSNMGDYSGFSVSGAGDFNDDGLADLIVGAWGANPNGKVDAGASYVVFGKANSDPVNLASLGTGGFRLEGVEANDFSGFSVSGAGTVNDGGSDDVIVGANGADTSGNDLAGESYAVFAQGGSGVVDLSMLGGGGFQIRGAAGDASGRSVGGAGDVNGDGQADLIIGAPGGNGGAGVGYVVFGKALGGQTVELSNLGADGFRIVGIDAGDSSGFSVAGAGDVNGDGLADLIVGAPGADPASNDGAGESYVVYGKTSTTDVDLNNLGAGGFRLDGNAAGDQSGWTVSGAGDVNGDGLADLIVGAPGVNGSAGASYVVFSAAQPQPQVSVFATSRNIDPPRTAFGVSGDGSNDSTPDARAWIDFSNGFDVLKTASRETMVLMRSAGNFPSFAANVSWQLQTSRTNWTGAELRVHYLDSELVGDESDLQIYYAAAGAAPFTALATTANPLDNSLTAIIPDAGFFYIGKVTPLVFQNGFE